MSNLVAEAGAILEIVWINILLSADNAILVALACRKSSGSSAAPRHHPSQQRPHCLAHRLHDYCRTVAQCSFSDADGRAIRDLSRGETAPPEFGSAPGRGQPNASQGRDGHHRRRCHRSLDNALALAAAAKGSVQLIVFGLLLSGPTVTPRSLLTKLMTRLPLLTWIGAVILGWAGGQLIARDPVFRLLNLREVPSEAWIGALGGAVVLVSAILRRNPEDPSKP